MVTFPVFIFIIGIYLHGRKKNNSEATQESAEYEHRSKQRRESQLRE